MGHGKIKAKEAMAYRSGMQVQPASQPLGNVQGTGRRRGRHRLCTHTHRQTMAQGTHRQVEKREGRPCTGVGVVTMQRRQRPGKWWHAAHVTHSSILSPLLQLHSGEAGEGWGSEQCSWSKPGAMGQKIC